MGHGTDPAGLKLEKIGHDLYKNQFQSQFAPLLWLLRQQWHRRHYLSLS